MRTARKAHDDASARTWADVVENAIRTALVVLVVAFNLSFVGVAASFLDLRQPRTATGVALLVATLVGIIIFARVWRWRRIGSWIVLTGGAIGLSLAAPMTQPSAQLADTWWPSAVIITTCTFLTLARMRWGWLMAGVLLLLNVVLRWQTWEPAPSLPHLTRSLEVLASTGQMVLLTASAWIVGTICRRAAHAVDAARAENEAIRTATLQRQDDERRAEEVDRFVHDEILHVLQLLAMTGEPIALAATREAAGRLLPQLPGRPATGPSRRPEGRLIARAKAEDGGFLRSVSDEMPIRVDVRAPVRVNIPAQVAEAVRAATREALRNVVQHAGSDRATVDVAVRGMVLTVTITDQGVGFVPHASARRGLASSIEDRMRDVGGGAEVRSTPGVGTCVQLTWSPAEEPDPKVLGAGLISEMFPYLVLMIMPRLALALWFGVLMIGQFPDAAALTVVSFVVVAAGGWGAAAALRQGRLSWVHSATLIAVACSATTLNGILLPHEASHPRLLWMPASAAAFVTLLAIYRPLRESIVCGVALSGATVAGTLHTASSVADWMPYFAPTMAPLVTLAMAAAVRIGAERMAWALYQAEHDSALAAARAESRDAFAGHLSSRLSRHIDPLRSLLRQAAELSDDDDVAPVRARAASLEMSVREALMVGDHDLLRGTLADLRRGGGEVSVRLSSGIPGEIMDACAAALRVLDPKQSRGVDLTALAVGDCWRLSVLVRPEPAASATRKLAAIGWRTTQLTEGLLARKDAPALPSTNGATSEADRR